MQSGAYATLVTGASMGIGLCVARQLVQASAGHVVITGRDPERLERAAKTLSECGRAQIYPILCDHAQQSAIELLAASLSDIPVPVLQLVANVGNNPVHQHGPGKTHSTSFELFSQTIATNLSHTFYLVAQLLSVMRQAREGRMVLVGSQAYRYGIAGQVSYNVSKSGLVGLKNTLVREYGGNNIFCHLLNPGLVLNARTARLRKQLPEGIETRAVTEQQVAQAIIDLLMESDKTRNGQEVDL